MKYDKQQIEEIFRGDNLKLQEEVKQNYLARADLTGANLARADLFGANLRCANL